MSEPDEPSIPCEWNGKVYDLDLTRYSGRDYDALEQRTGEKWRHTFLGLVQLEPSSLRAPFWLTDRREDPDLKWSEYDGPASYIVMPHLPAVREAIYALGKAITGKSHEELQEMNGSDDSPSEPDTPPPSTTP